MGFGVQVHNFGWGLILFGTRIVNRAFHWPDPEFSLFCQLNQEGITVILVTREMDVANQTKRIIRLSDGQVASDEKVAQKKR